MKFLVLSYNTGLCHNSADLAINDMFISLGHECEIMDASEYVSNVLPKSVSESYHNSPKAFGAGYSLGKSQSYNASCTVSMTFSKKLYQDITEQNYDAVICTHVFPAQIITQVKQRNHSDIPVFFVATDYCYYPYCDKLDVAEFFVATESVVGKYTERGITKDKIVPTGIPVSMQFSAEVPKNMAKSALGLDDSRFLCLIIPGSIEIGSINELIDTLLKSPSDNFDIIVLAGNNHRLKDKINKTYHSYSNVGTIGYTDKTDLYIKACDVIITNPCGISSTEAMVSGVPLILTKPISGCESDNYKMLTEMGTALEGKTTEQAAFSFECVLYNENVRNSLILNQAKYINRHASQTICERIINYVNNFSKGNT